MPPKRNKKGRGDDSDDDVIASKVSTLKISEPVEEKSNNKKDKKEKKKGGRGKGDSDDDVDPLEKMKKLASKADSDDEDESPRGGKSSTKKTSAPSVQSAPASKKDSKKDKKKGTGKGRGGDSDDDEDPMALMKKLAAVGNKGNSDVDDEEEEESDGEESRRNAAIAAAAAAKKQQQQQQQQASSNASSTGKKDSKKDKKKGGRGRADSDGDEDPMEIMNKLASQAEQTAASEEEVIDDDEEQLEEQKLEEAPLTSIPTQTEKKKEKKSDKEKSKKNSKQQSVADKDDNDEKDNHGGDGHNAAEIASTASKPTKSASVSHSSTEVISSQADSPPPAVKVSQAVTVVASFSITAPAPISIPISVPIPTAAVIEAAEPEVETEANDSGKPKSKLQLKMEKAKQEKAKRDAALAQAAEEERLRLAAEKQQQQELQQQQEAEAKERLQREAEEAAELARTATASVAEGPAAKSAAVSSSASSASSVKTSTTLTEEEMEMRMKATMFGDEVFSEYGHPSQGGAGGTGKVLTQEEQIAEIVAAGKSGRISNKERRRLAKEAEAAEREAELQRMLKKASVEGAQFAVSQSIINPDDPMWQNALDIVIPSVSISAHNKELFVNAELMIGHGRRYGLVGPNGAGKSTLLKMIAYGELKVPPRVDYLYVEQEVVADSTPAVDAVLKADKERWMLVEEEQQLLKLLEQGPNEALDARLGEVYEELSQINASSAESKARRILFGLGFDAEMQIRPTKYFSGGWRMRISLARALFMEPTLLMLDEPTNHLDLNAVIWLDDYLQKWKKTLLIVSHDQDFLNSVCQEIIHLDDKKLVVYKGDYDNFKRQEAVKREQQQKAWERQEKKLRELKAKGITKENAEKVQLKSRSREPGARAQKAMAAAAASGGQESGANQAELIKRPREYDVEFHFPDVPALNPPLLQVKDVTFQYGPNMPVLFKNLEFGLDMSSRVCIVGPNGSGKSTLLKLITGDLNPPEGSVIRNQKLRIGVYNQHFVDRLPMDEDPIAYLRRLYNDKDYQSVRNLLGKFGLEGHAHTIRIRDLSGGQKARVVFAELSLMSPHILFLDEPTNNLDIESIDALCDSLRKFNGGVVLVSHDARLIETTDCRLWVVEDQTVYGWDKGFQAYRQDILDKLEAQLNLIMPGSGERPGEKAVSKK